TLAIIPFLIAGAILAALLGRGLLLLATVELTGCIWLLKYTSWWLDRRLLCLGGDRSAIGLLLSLERPEDKRLFDHYDSDFNLDILLPPCLVGVDQETAAASAIQRALITETGAISRWALPFTGEEGADSTTAI